MPQMSPYNWLMLFFYFNFMMTYLITYTQFFFVKYSPVTNTPNINPMNFKWMW